MKRYTILLVLIIFLYLFVQVEAKTIHVPADSSTIQKGINGANHGDTVLVGMGIYSKATNGELLPINMKNGITLLSESGTELTRISGNYDTTVIYCLNADSNTIIKGFEISKGKATKGGGIYSQNSLLRINDCKITYNQATYGAGVYCQDGSSKLVNSKIIGNKAIYGAGIYCQGGSPILDSNMVSYDSTINGYGAGIYCFKSSFKIRSNQINNNIVWLRGNGPIGYGAGIYCESSMVEITDNLIEGNLIHGIYSDCNYGNGLGAGIYCIKCTSPLIVGNIIQNNLVYSTFGSAYGGGIYSSYSINSVISYNVINGNSPQAVYVDNSLVFRINNNTIDSSAGSGIDCNLSTLDVNNNIITRSTSGAGIHCGPGSNLEISYNDVWNNKGGNFSACPAGIGDTTKAHNHNGTPCDTFYNITRDPLLSTSLDSLYHLQGQSPCINAGNPFSPKDPDSTIADIGAFYYPKFICGDANHDNRINLADVVYIVCYVFKGGAQPIPLVAGDANGDGQVTVADIVFLISYLFKRGPSPIC